MPLSRLATHDNEIRNNNKCIFMNTQAEIQKAFADYRSTQFGGWPWDSDAVVFERSRGRFAEMRSSKGGKTIDLPPSRTEADL